MKMIHPRYGTNNTSTTTLPFDTQKRTSNVANNPADAADAATAAQTR